MRRDRSDEENVHLQRRGKEEIAVCGVCGTVLQKDKESGEYRCAECDEEEIQ